MDKLQDSSTITRQEKFWNKRRAKYFFKMNIYQNLGCEVIYIIEKRGMASIFGKNESGSDLKYSEELSIMRQEKKEKVGINM